MKFYVREAYEYEFSDLKKISEKIYGEPYGGWQKLVFLDTENIEKNWDNDYCCFCIVDVNNIEELADISKKANHRLVIDFVKRIHSGVNFDGEIIIYNDYLE